MPRARANGIEIEYDSFGRPEDPAVLLVMGLAGQMIRWNEAFCARLAERGHHVVRFDNRDVGLSTRLDALGVPDPLRLMERAARGETPDVPYRLSDMAADTIGLLDALGLGAAHLVGTSLGGMIAQTAAIEHPERVASLTSIMSSTGDPSLPPGKPEVTAILVTPVPTARDAWIDYQVRVTRALSGSGFSFDEEYVRGLAARAYDRSFHPAGAMRQLAAIVGSGSRKAALGSLRVPTLVIHGTEDPLVPLEHGRATHAAIPGSRLMPVEGLGHDLPPTFWPQLVDALGWHVASA